MTWQRKGVRASAIMILTMTISWLLMPWLLCVALNSVPCKLRVNIIFSLWGRDKMVAILQMTFWTLIFLYGNCCVLVQISVKYVPRGPINNKPWLVQIMAWRQRGDKPLSEPIMASFTDAYGSVPGAVWQLWWVVPYRLCRRQLQATQGRYRIPLWLLIPWGLLH